MGGTSTDVGVVTAGEIGYTTEYQVEWGVPIAAPFIDLTTIGAGGGSIAWIDKGGFLKVGPQSAGALPGPMCYRAGGTEPTVTDANLVLGRLDAEDFLGGQMVVDPKAAAPGIVRRIADPLKMSAAAAAQALLAIAGSTTSPPVREGSVANG